MPIDRVFTIKGFGTVVTGTLWSGAITPDSELALWPSGTRVRVRGLQVHGEPADRAAAGQRVAVNLAGVALDDVARGHALLGEGVAIASRRVAVDVDILPDAPPQKHGTRVHVHLGTAAVLGRLILPVGVAAVGARIIASGGRASGVLRLETPLPMRRGDRLVLRSYSPLSTVGGAIVTDPWPPSRFAHQIVVDGADAETLVAARVREAGAIGCAAADLPARCGLAPGAAQRTAQALADRGLLVHVGDAWVDAGVLATVRAALLARIDAAHASDPLAGGVPRAVLRTAGGRRWRPEIADLVLERLAGEGLTGGDDRVSRADTRAMGRDPVDTRVLAAVESAGLHGRSLPELESSGGLDRKALQGVLARLVRAKDVERLGDLYMSMGRLRALPDELRRLAGTGAVPARIEVGWFKEHYGLTRRTAIPLLEWLDRTRVTRREGDVRVLIPRSPVGSGETGGTA